MSKAIETTFDGYKFRSRLEARWAVFFKTLNIEYEYEKEGYKLEHVQIDGRDTYFQTQVYHYLPDFWLPNVGEGCWVEIKGEEPSDEEILKAGLLAYHTGKWVNLFYGPVGEQVVLSFFSRRPPDEIVKYARQAIEQNQLWLFRLLTSSDEVFWDNVRKEAYESRGWKTYGKRTRPYRQSSERIVCFCPDCQNLSFGYADHTVEDEERYQCPECGFVSKRPTGETFTFPGFGQCFYCGIVDTSDECPYPDHYFSSNQHIKKAYAAARRARFEFGETPIG